MADYFTVCVPDNYTIEESDENTIFRFENKDRVVINNERFKQFKRSRRLQIPFSDVEEVVQKTAKVSQVITKGGTILTVNSKNGIRLFKFLNFAEKKIDNW